MSQIPRPNAGKPVIKSTTTIKQQIPGGGSRTTTKTTVRELEPCSTADASLTQGGSASCKECPSTQSGQRNVAGVSTASRLKPPSTTTSGMRQQPSAGMPRQPSGLRSPAVSNMKPTAATSGMGMQTERPAADSKPPCPQRTVCAAMKPQARSQTSRGAPKSKTPQSASAPICPQAFQPCKRPAGAPSGRQQSSPAAPAPQLQPPAPGQYNVPAQYGPMSRQGKAMTFSSPEGLRTKMEARVPKEVKYGTIRPEAGGRGRAALKGTAMSDTFAGNYNVYGGPTTREEVVDRSELDERLNKTAAQELFNMSSPEVSRVEELVQQQLMDLSMLDPTEKITAKGKQIHCVTKAPMVQTPKGMQPVLQQSYSEKRVERDEHAETITKHLVVTDIDETTGAGSRVTVTEKRYDPDYGLTGEGKDTITVKETISVTRSFTSTATDICHETLTPRIDIDPAELAQLVADETEDVENTLKMAPPDLSFAEDRYGTKKRLQKLRLNTESMILIEESVVNPPPTADEAMVETPPEALASIMHTVESGVTPECAPDQIFHTLFEEKITEQSVVLSSIGPGPLQDVVVPEALTKDIHKESMTNELTELTEIYKNVTDAKDWPPVDLFDSVMDADAKSPKKGVTQRKFKPLQDEEMPWEDEDLEAMVNIVGAEPVVVLEPIDLANLTDPENLQKEMTQGIEYFVDADPLQYMSKVQLRGSQPPPWFPGYIYCLPEFPDVIKLARNPDEVFIGSWRSCQPKLIPENSMSVSH